MKKPSKNTFLISLMLLFTFHHGTTLAGKVYKWVDDQGKVYYSDRVPPSDSKQGRAIINTQGRTVEKVDAAKTREQLEKEAHLAKIHAEEQRKIDEQDEKDRVLLSTFHNIEGLVHARDTKITAVNNTIHISKSTLNNMIEKLRTLTESAAENERAGRKVPKFLGVKIDEEKKSIQSTRYYINRKKDEKEAIRRKYEADIKRYKKLTETAKE